VPNGAIRERLVDDDPGSRTCGSDRRGGALGGGAREWGGVGPVDREAVPEKDRPELGER
jgi:hypothetical protein